MSEVSNPTISNKTFQSQSDNFWSNLDGKKSYLKEINSMGSQTPYATLITLNSKIKSSKSYL